MHTGALPEEVDESVSPQYVPFSYGTIARSPSASRSETWTWPWCEKPSLGAAAARAGGAVRRGEQPRLGARGLVLGSRLVGARRPGEHREAADHQDPGTAGRAGSHEPHANKPGSDPQAASAALATGGGERYLPRHVWGRRSGVTRRRLLGGGLAAAALAAGAPRARRSARARSSGSASSSSARARRWNPRPSALRRLGWEIEKRTSIDVELEPAIVTPTSDTLHETPFLYLAGEREIELPSAAGHRGAAPVPHVRRLPADRLGRGLDRRRVRRLGPQADVGGVPAAGAKGLEVIPSDHVVYKSFYLLDKPARPARDRARDGGRDPRRPPRRARTSPNDLGGAWARDDFGNYEFPCEPGGERQRELAFRLGVNLVMYALCLDYKADQVHVPFIMKRRRWKPDDGAIDARADAAEEAVNIVLFSDARALRARGRGARARDRDGARGAARQGRRSARRSASRALLSGGALAAEALVALTVRLAAPGAADFNEYRWVMLAPWGRLGLALGGAAVDRDRRAVVAREPRRARRGGARR